MTRGGRGRRAKRASSGRPFLRMRSCGFDRRRTLKRATADDPRAGVGTAPENARSGAPSYVLVGSRRFAAVAESGVRGACESKWDRARCGRGACVGARPLLEPASWQVHVIRDAGATAPRRRRRRGPAPRLRSRPRPAAAAACAPSRCAPAPAPAPGGRTTGGDAAASRPRRASAAPARTSNRSSIITLRGARAREGLLERLPAPRPLSAARCERARPPARRHCQAGSLPLDSHRLQRVHTSRRCRWRSLRRAHSPLLLMLLRSGLELFFAVGLRLDTAVSGAPPALDRSKRRHRGQVEGPIKDQPGRFNVQCTAFSLVERDTSKVPFVSSGTTAHTISSLAHPGRTTASPTWRPAGDGTVNRCNKRSPPGDVALRRARWLCSELDRSGEADCGPYSPPALPGGAALDPQVQARRRSASGADSWTRRATGR